MNKRMEKIGTISLLLATLVAQHAIASTYRASVTSDGAQLSSTSSWPSISGNGRYVTFASNAAELAATSSNRQLYRHDVLTGDTRLISRNSSGQPGSGDSLFGATMNYDGNLVAFMSYAKDLGDGVPSDIGQLYIHDVDLGKTRIASTSSKGELGNQRSEMPTLSADGKYIAFYSLATNLVDQDTNNSADIFLKNLETDETRIVSRGAPGESNARSMDVAISGNGDIVAFISHASNLVPDDTNGLPDAFVYHTSSGVVERISISNDGIEGNKQTLRVAVSANGRYVAFLSDASNLVATDGNDTRDLFIRDLKMGTTVRATEHAGGESFVGTVTNMDISADGRYVLFESYAPHEFQVPSSGYKLFIKDMVVGDIRQADVGLDGTSYENSGNATLSHDGQHLAYTSAVSNLVANDTNAVGDIFVTRVGRDSGDSEDSLESRSITVTETVYVPVTEIVYEPVYQTVEVEKIVEVEVCTADTAEPVSDDVDKQENQSKGKHWGLHWYKDDGNHDESHSGEHPVFDNDKHRVAFDLKAMK